MTAGWDPVNGPSPPENVQVVTDYQIGVLDIRWDDPSILQKNTAYQIVGVNVYRSDVSDRGPYHRINPYPLGGTFFRDQTENEKVVNEVVQWDSSWVNRGESANSRRWMLRTSCPIVKNPVHAPFQKPTPANSPLDVMVTVDGKISQVSNVFGPTGEITLVNTTCFNPTTEKTHFPELPNPDGSSTVLITYWRNRNHIRSGLDAKIWYRLTTVALDATTPSGLIETELKYTEPVTNINVEKMDYIWRRAIQMNNWILEQGGERVKVFIRKQSGIRCPCTLDERGKEYNKQPNNRCLLCYGTGICGGYEGPYEIIVCGEDSPRAIPQTPWGRHVDNAYDVWFGPSPAVTQRDFIVKQTNERYSIGPVQRPSNRGVFLQQHFPIRYLDEGDVRYCVPIDGVSTLPWPQTRLIHDPDVLYPVLGTRYAPLEDGARAVMPMETEKATEPDETEQRGRTPVWENIQY